MRLLSVLAWVLLTQPSSDEVHQRLFITERVPVGGSPTELVSADIDDDGRADLAVLCEAAGSVHVLEGVGDGRFEGVGELAIDENPRSLAIADFNSDHHADLIAVRSTGFEAALMLGKADSSFSDPMLVPVASQPADLAVGDFNDDGMLDIVVTAPLAGVSVFHGTGAGSFQFSSNKQLGADPGKILAHDLTTDGLEDLVVLDEVDGTVSILIATGESGFEDAISLSPGSNPRDIGVGDFEGDGLPDLVVLDNKASKAGGADVLLTVRGEGDGGFGAPQAIVTAALASGLAVFDVTSDSVSDVFVVESSGGEGVVLHLSLKDGGIGGYSGLQLGEGPGAMLLRDINGDAITDIVRSNTTHSDLSVGLGVGGGAFLAPSWTESDGIPSDLLAVDIDADGHQDLVSADLLGGAVSVRSGHGACGLGQAARYAIGGFPVRLDSTDVNLDGLSDLAVLVGASPPASSSIAVLLAQGSGGLAPPVKSLVSTSASDIASSDFDSDGLPDFVVSSFALKPVGFYEGDGGGGAVSQTSVRESSSVVWIDAGDVNGDGDVDFVGGGGDTVGVFAGTGDGRFTAVPAVSATAPVRDVALMDLDADGSLDLVILDGSGFSSALGPGNGEFLELANAVNGVAFPETIGEMSFGDLDADGLVDLVFVDDYSRSIEAAMGVGNGTFGPVRKFESKGQSARIAIGEFDGDRYPDVVLAPLGGMRDGRVAVLRNQALGPWTDLGGGVAGEYGVPGLSGSGPLIAGSALHIRLSGVLGGGVATLLASSAANEWCSGRVDVLSSPSIAVLIAVSEGGLGSVSGTWPRHVAPGTELFLQAVASDVVAPNGLTASNVLWCVVP